MFTSEVTVGGYYILKLKTGNTTVVRISRAGDGRKGRWHAINLETGRELYLASSKRLRRKASEAEIEDARIRRSGKLSKHERPKADLTSALEPMRDLWEARNLCNRLHRVLCECTDYMMGKGANFQKVEQLRRLAPGLCQVLDHSATYLGSIIGLEVPKYSPSPIDPPTDSNPGPRVGQKLAGLMVISQSPVDDSQPRYSSEKPYNLVRLGYRIWNSAEEFDADWAAHRRAWL